MIWSILEQRTWISSIKYVNTAYNTHFSLHLPWFPSGKWKIPDSGIKLDFSGIIWWLFLNRWYLDKIRCFDDESFNFINMSTSSFWHMFCNDDNSVDGVIFSHLQSPMASLLCDRVVYTYMSMVYECGYIQCGHQSNISRMNISSNIHYNINIQTQ